MSKKGIPFAKAIDEIRKDPSFNDELSLKRLVGRARELIVDAVLWDMERSGEILSHVMTQRLSRPDLRGIDAYVIKLHAESTCRKVIPVSVTGEIFVKKHLQMHPKIPVITVSVNNNTGFLLKIRSSKNQQEILNLIGSRATEEVKRSIRELLDEFLNKK